MSITGFQDAIKDQVSHYDDTVKTLRDNEIFQRNNALAGIQSEVEKYGEIAKLGLEFPVAIEGIKAVAKGAKGAFNALGKAKGVAEDALSSGRDALSNITSQLEGGTEGLAARARSAVPSYSSLSERFDNLRVGDNIPDTGNLRNLVTEPRLQGADGDSLTGEGTEMSPMDDLMNNNSLLSPDTYGRDQPTSTRVPTDAEGGVGSTDPVTAPVAVEERAPVQRFLGRVEPARPSNPNVPQSVVEDPDDPAPRSRPGDIEMSDLNSRPSMIRQPDQGFNELERGQNPDYRPPRPSSRAPGAGEYDDELIRNTEPTDPPPPVPGSEPEISPIVQDTAEEAGASLGGEAAATTEEAIGGGLLASGIFAPLGALLEGIGAVTEVASVGAGVYGAVQSMIDTGKEEALRNTPLKPVSGGNLDVGGSIAAPELA